MIGCRRPLWAQCRGGGAAAFVLGHCSAVHLLSTYVRTWSGVAGTPIQNNMAELYGIMSMLDPSAFGDEDEFLERYGGGRLNPMPSPEQIQALQVPACTCWLRPYASSCSSCAHVTMPSMSYLESI